MRLVLPGVICNCSEPSRISYLWVSSAHSTVSQSADECTQLYHFLLLTPSTLSVMSFDDPKLHTDMVTYVTTRDMTTINGVVA